MFGEIDNETEKVVVVEFGMELDAVEPLVSAQVKLSLSKHRQDTGRIQGHLFDPNDVIAAIQEKMNEDQPKAARVQFAEESKQKLKFLHEIPMK
jgi:hypothetical protein